MAAIGKFVLWGKENLCLVRPHGDTLALETLFFGEDVRSRAEIEEAVGETDVKAPELDLATQVIREPRRRVSPRGLRERAPPRSPRDARGEGRGRGDQAARAGARHARRRPDGGAAAFRRGGRRPRCTHEESRSEERLSVSARSRAQICVIPAR